MSSYRFKVRVNDVPYRVKRCEVDDTAADLVVGKPPTCLACKRPFPEGALKADPAEYRCPHCKVVNRFSPRS